jgi:hypothetical protein
MSFGTAIFAPPHDTQLPSRISSAKLSRRRRTARRAKEEKVMLALPRDGGISRWAWVRVSALPLIA